MATSPDGDVGGHLKRHPEPHRDRLVPRREGLADPIDRQGKAPPIVPPM